MNPDIDLTRQVRNYTKVKLGNSCVCSQNTGFCSKNINRPCYCVMPDTGPCQHIEDCYLSEDSSQRSWPSLTPSFHDSDVTIQTAPKILISHSDRKQVLEIALSFIHKFCPMLTLKPYCLPPVKRSIHPDRSSKQLVGRTEDVWTLPSRAESERLVIECFEQFFARKQHPVFMLCHYPISGFMQVYNGWIGRPEIVSSRSQEDTVTIILLSHTFTVTVVTVCAVDGGSDFSDVVRSIRDSAVRGSRCRAAVDQWLSVLGIMPKVRQVIAFPGMRRSDCERNTIREDFWLQFGLFSLLLANELSAPVEEEWSTSAQENAFSEWMDREVMCHDPMLSYEDVHLVVGALLSPRLSKVDYVKSHKKIVPLSVPRRNSYKMEDGLEDVSQLKLTIDGVTKPFDEFMDEYLTSYYPNLEGQTYRVPPIHFNIQSFKKPSEILQCVGKDGSPAPNDIQKVKDDSFSDNQFQKVDDSSVSENQFQKVKDDSFSDNQFKKVDDSSVSENQFQKVCDNLVSENPFQKVDDSSVSENGSDVNEGQRIIQKRKLKSNSKSKFMPPDRSSPLMTAVWSRSYSDNADFLVYPTWSKEANKSADIEAAVSSVAAKDWKHNQRSNWPSAYGESYQRRNWQKRRNKVKYSSYYNSDYLKLGEPLEANPGSIPLASEMKTLLSDIEERLFSSDSVSFGHKWIWPSPNIQGLSSNNQQFQPNIQWISSNNQWPPSNNQWPPSNNQWLSAKNQRLSPKNQQLPPKNQQLPPQNQQFSPKNQQLPPQNQQIPPKNQQLPPQNQQLPPKNQQLPPKNQQLPPKNQELPPQNQQFSPKNQELPPQNQQFSPNNPWLSPNSQQLPPNNQWSLRNNRRLPPNIERLRHKQEDENRSASLPVSHERFIQWSSNVEQSQSLTGLEDKRRFFSLPLAHETPTSMPLAHETPTWMPLPHETPTSMPNEEWSSPNNQSKHDNNWSAPTMKEKLTTGTPQKVRSAKAMCLEALQDVQVLDEVMDKDTRADEGENRVICALESLGEEYKPMFIICRYQYNNYLNKLKKGMFPKGDATRPITAFGQTTRAEHDCLIFHQKYGAIIVAIKAIGDNFSEWGATDDQKTNSINRILEKAVEQLEREEAMVRHVTSDLHPNLACHKLIALPNMRRASVEKALGMKEGLMEELSSVLGYGLELFLCSDELPSKFESVWDNQDQNREKLRMWWKNAMEQFSSDQAGLTYPVYRKIIGRYCGLLSTVEVWSSANPRVEVRSVSEAISVCAERYCKFVLLPHQIKAICSSDRQVFLYGPPGCGKTLVLILKAREWLLAGEDVVLINSRPYSEKGFPYAYGIFNRLRRMMEDWRVPPERLLIKNIDCMSFHTDNIADVRPSCCIMMDEVTPASHCIIDHLCSLPVKNIWCAGLFEEDKPSRTYNFTSFKMKKILRCPPVVQSLLKHTEPVVRIKMPYKEDYQLSSLEMEHLHVGSSSDHKAKNNKEMTVNPEFIKENNSSVDNNLKLARDCGDQAENCEKGSDEPEIFYRKGEIYQEGHKFDSKSQDQKLKEKDTKTRTKDAFNYSTSSSQIGLPTDGPRPHFIDHSVHQSAGSPNECFLCGHQLAEYLNSMVKSESSPGPSGRIHQKDKKKTKPSSKNSPASSSKGLLFSVSSTIHTKQPSSFTHQQKTSVSFDSRALRWSDVLVVGRRFPKDSPFLEALKHQCIPVKVLKEGNAVEIEEMKDNELFVTSYKEVTGLERALIVFVPSEQPNIREPDVTKSINDLQLANCIARLVDEDRVALWYVASRSLASLVLILP